MISTLPIGERSGVHCALVLGAPVRDACNEGLRAVEFGAGAHQAKVLRGCVPRAITTVMLLADPDLRQDAAAWLDEFGRERHAVFDATAVTAPAVQPQVTGRPTAEHHACRLMRRVGEREVT